MIVKEGKEVPVAVVASVFVVLALVCFLTPLRDQVSRHGFPMWLLGLGLAFSGLVLWAGVVQNLLHRRR